MNGSPEKPALTDSVEVGIYRHFKGGEYRVFGVRRESDGNAIVEYQSLSDGEHHQRDVKEFLGEVDKPEFGYQGPRFTYLRHE